MRPTLQAKYTELASLVKDLREAFAATLDTEIFEFKGQYVQGLTLPLKTCPRAIELIRCVNPQAPGVATGHGSTVEWIWTAAGARVLRIEGLTPATTPYVFTFKSTF